MTFTKDDDNPNPDTLEVHSQVLSATAVLQGSPVPLSPVGTLAYEPATSYATGPGGGAGQYLVVWQQESPPPGIFDRDVGPARALRRRAALARLQDLRGRSGVHHRPVGRRPDRRDRPRGRIRVKIEVRTVDGRKVSTTRRYRTCAPKRR